MDVNYSGTVYYDLDSIMSDINDTMTDDEIRDILYNDFCRYDDFDYSVLCDNINQVLYAVRSRIGEQMMFDEFRKEL